MSDAVRVFVRFRPDDDDVRQVPLSINGSKVTLKGAGRYDNDKEFSCSKVYDTSASQEVIYREVCSDLIDRVWHGFNGCVFAYGQTGSGKTHSLVGPPKLETGDAISGTQRGLIPRMIEGVMIEAAARGAGACNVAISIVELYCDTLRDLGRAYLASAASSAASDAHARVGSAASASSNYSDGKPPMVPQPQRSRANSAGTISSAYPHLSSAQQQHEQQSSVRDSRGTPSSSHLRVRTADSAMSSTFRDSVCTSDETPISTSELVARRAAARKSFATPVSSAVVESAASVAEQNASAATVFSRADRQSASASVSRNRRPSSGAGSLLLREDGAGRVFVEGLTHVPLRHAADGLSVLQSAFTLRATHATGMNDTSSRSHVVVTLHVSQRDVYSGEMVTSQLNMIDLAGSECVAKTGNESGPRLAEAQSVNLSLTALGKVVKALARSQLAADVATWPSSEGTSKIESANGAASSTASAASSSTPTAALHISARSPARNTSSAPPTTIHVPFRDCSLTRLLQSSLGGNSLTRILCTATPAASELPETLSTLAFAERCQCVKNVAEAVLTPSASETASERIIQLQWQTLALRHALVNARLSGALRTVRMLAEVGVNGSLRADGTFACADTGEVIGIPEIEELRHQYVSRAAALLAPHPGAFNDYEAAAKDVAYASHPECGLRGAGDAIYLGLGAAMISGVAPTPPPRSQATPVSSSSHGATSASGAGHDARTWGSLHTVGDVSRAIGALASLIPHNAFAIDRSGAPQSSSPAAVECRVDDGRSAVAAAVSSFISEMDVSEAAIEAGISAAIVGLASARGVIGGQRGPQSSSTSSSSSSNSPAASRIPILGSLVSADSFSNAITSAIRAHGALAAGDHLSGIALSKAGRRASLLAGNIGADAIAAVATELRRRSLVDESAPSLFGPKERIMQGGKDNAVAGAARSSSRGSASTTTVAADQGSISLWPKCESCSSALTTTTSRECSRHSRTSISSIETLESQAEMLTILEGRYPAAALLSQQQRKQQEQAQRGVQIEASLARAVAARAQLHEVWAATSQPLTMGVLSGLSGGASALSNIAPAIASALAQEEWRGGAAALIIQSAAAPAAVTPRVSSAARRRASTGAYGLAGSLTPMTQLQPHSVSASSTPRPPSSRDHRRHDATSVSRTTNRTSRLSDDRHDATSVSRTSSRTSRLGDAEKACTCGYSSTVNDWIVNSSSPQGAPM